MASNTSTANEHSVVTIIANDDGTYKAKLYSNGQYEDPYVRSHIESVTLNGDNFFLRNGERQHFKNLEVTLDTTSIALNT